MTHPNSRDSLPCGSGWQVSGRLSCRSDSCEEWSFRGRGTEWAFSQVTLWSFKEATNKWREFLTVSLLETSCLVALLQAHLCQDSTISGGTLSLWGISRWSPQAQLWALGLSSKRQTLKLHYPVWRPRKKGSLPSSQLLLMNFSRIIMLVLHNSEGQMKCTRAISPNCQSSAATLSKSTSAS